jgi:hypothetical protein
MAMRAGPEPYRLHFEAAGVVGAPPAAVFDHLDDPHRLSAHMEQPSAAMLGTRMSLECDAQGGRAIGSEIRMAGQVFGVRLDLVEVITARVPPALKAWETQGEPRLLVIGRYRMGFRIAAAPGGSRLAVFIDYAHPTSAAGRLAGRMFGGSYARWCCRRMVRDAQRAFAAAAVARA